ncbi:hypothetical protein HDU86_002787 [Geranomyces michiganensis]|nr:hypothetical protein HDU86_002787 [Geranomyces michiganensis]
MVSPLSPPRASSRPHPPPPGAAAAATAAAAPDFPSCLSLIPPYDNSHNAQHPLLSLQLDPSLSILPSELSSYSTILPTTTTTDNDDFLAGLDPPPEGHYRPLFSPGASTNTTATTTRREGGGGGGGRREQGGGGAGASFADDDHQSVCSSAGPSPSERAHADGEEEGWCAGDSDGGGDDGEDVAAQEAYASLIRRVEEVLGYDHNTREHMGGEEEEQKAAAGNGDEKEDPETSLLRKVQEVLQNSSSSGAGPHQADDDGSLCGRSWHGHTSPAAAADYGVDAMARTENDPSIYIPSIDYQSMVSDDTIVERQVVSLMAKYGVIDPNASRYREPESTYHPLSPPRRSPLSPSSPSHTKVSLAAARFSAPAAPMAASAATSFTTVSSSSYSSSSFTDQLSLGSLEYMARHALITPKRKAHQQQQWSASPLKRELVPAPAAEYGMAPRDDGGGGILQARRSDEPMSEILDVERIRRLPKLGVVRGQRIGG